MFSEHNFLLFLVAAILLNLAPGPDLLYVLSRSVAQGKRAGRLSSFGVCTGALVHAMAAALGLSAILATSAYAFSVVKWVGALYLIYLGLHAIFSKNGHLSFDSLEVKEQSGWAIFSQGVLTDVLNPKVAIFFLSFLPQFVDPKAGCQTVQLLVLGLIVVLIAVIWEFVVVSFAARITRVLRNNSWLTPWLNRTMGLIFIGLGVRLATEKG